MSEYLSINKTTGKPHYSYAQAQQCHEREHGLYFHPRTGEKIVCLSEANIRYKTIWKPKAERMIINGDMVIKVPSTDKVNGTIPQIAYHRIVNAITETPVKVCKSGDGHKFLENPATWQLKAVNTKKHYYGERKHGYASKAIIEAHQQPRWNPPEKEAPHKLRISASGKLKLCRI